MAAARYLLFLSNEGLFLRRRFFLSDIQNQVQQDPENRRSGNCRELRAEHGDHAVGKREAAADADGQDGGDNREVARVEHVNLFADHNGYALRRDDAEQVNGNAADHRVGNRVDRRGQRGEAGNNHGDDGRRNQHRRGKVLSNRHGAQVFAVIGTGRSADHTGDHIAKAVADQVQPQLVRNIVPLIGSLLFGKIVYIDIELIKMGRGFRNSGNRDRHNRPDRRPACLRQSEVREREADRRDGKQCACFRNFIEVAEGDSVDAAKNQRQNISGQKAEQNRDLAPGTFQVNGEQDSHEQGHKADGPRQIQRKRLCRIGHAVRQVRGIAQGRAREGKTDHHGNAARNGGRKDLFDCLLPELLDDNTGRNGNQSGKDDAELRGGDFVIGHRAGKRLCACDGADRRDVRKTRSVEKRDSSSCNQDKSDGCKSACKDRGGNMESGEQCDQHRSRKHHDDLLEREQQQFQKRWLFIRQIARCGLFG